MGGKKLILAAIAVTTIFFVLPGIREIREWQRKNEQLEISLQKNIKKLKKLDAERAKISVSSDVAEKKIPRKIEQQNVIYDLRKIFLQSGFEIADLKFAKNFNEKVGAHELKVDFLARGPLERTRDFLRLIEKNERFLGLEKFDVATAVKNNRAIASFSATVFAFFREN